MPQVQRSVALIDGDCGRQLAAHLAWCPLLSRDVRLVQGCSPTAMDIPRTAHRTQPSSYSDIGALGYFSP